jgi:hypothetical protein
MNDVLEPRRNFAGEEVTTELGQEQLEGDLVLL